MDSFKIDSENIQQVIFELLLIIAADQKAMMSFLLDDDLQKRDGSFEKTIIALDLAKAFHKEEVLKLLYQNFASLKDILPPEVDGSD